MSNKAVFSIFIDVEVRKKARENGLNISKICENRLRFLLQRIDDTSIIPDTACTSTDSQKSSTEVLTSK
jgi:hypothetical protein